MKRWLGEKTLWLKYEDWGSGPQNPLTVRLVWGVPVVLAFGVGAETVDSRSKLAS